MSRGHYCLECGERWTLEPDRHQMKCAARALLLRGSTHQAMNYRGRMDDAPRPAVAVRPSTRADRGYRCSSCGRSWSIYPQNHERGCSAAYLLVRGQRDDARKRWRIRPGELARPDAAPSLAARFRGVGGAR